MKTLVNITSDKKDIVRANNAVLGFKDVIGETLTINGVVIYEKEEVNENTGEIEQKTVTAIKKAEDGEFITSVSPTVKSSLDAVLEVYSEDEIKGGIEIIVKSKKSNAGRDFIYIDLA